MKIVQINAFSNGSTGKIMMNIHNELLKRGHDSYVIWGRGRKAKNNREIYLNDSIGVYTHALISRINGKVGFYSKKITKKIINSLEQIKPDIVHLHNVHGYYINIKLLFDFLKENNIQVVWTLHDCWAVTGHCAYFDYVNCSKWKTQCYKCPNLESYPKSILDNTEKNQLLKKEIFTSLENMVLVTPSNWLKSVINNSYLNKYKIKTIYNGVDFKLFKKTKSDFKQKNNLINKKIILGVANCWEKRKGLDDFIKLSKLLDDSYKIILVGLSKKQIKNMPSNILGIQRTDGQEQLAELYSIAEYYFNASVEETFGLTTIEALACGTPCIVYNSTALPEIIENSLGYIVEKNNIQEVYKIITSPKEKINYNNTLKRIKKYSIENMTNNYINLYSNLKEGGVSNI